MHCIQMMALLKRLVWICRFSSKPMLHLQPFTGSRTPSQGDVESIRILLASGADPFKKDRPYSRTCLHYAALKGHAAAIHAVLTLTTDRVSSGHPRYKEVMHGGMVHGVSSHGVCMETIRMGSAWGPVGSDLLNLQPTQVLLWPRTILPQALGGHLHQVGVHPAALCRLVRPPGGSQGAGGGRREASAEDRASW